jgi:hypothetical protein
MSVMEGFRASKAFTNESLRRLPEPRSERCLNCGTPLAGPFCAHCGQRDIPPYPSVRELVTDAFWELSGWDGRFSATIKALIRAPGQLTLDFLEGRRARFISPLRLYLLASLLYFVAAASAPELTAPDGTSISAPGIRIGAGTAAGRVSAAEAKAGGGQLSAAERDSALADIARAPRVLRPVLRRAVIDRAGFKRSLIETMPRVLFALVPVFAAIVALFYRRRKYPEHLYFGLHLHAFFFVALTISAAAKFTHQTIIATGVGMVVAGWITVYSVKAARRVYGGSVGATIAKGTAISALYSVAGLIGLLAAVFWAALRA